MSHDLAMDSKALKDIDGLLKQTIPTAKVKKVQILQNFHLWNAYQVEVKKLCDKLQKAPETQLLWHGTSKTDPKLIYEGEVGFDIRYSGEGNKWGPAIYFAKNASYSHGCSWTNPQGEKVMFLADVLLGDYIQMPSDDRLKMPPPKNDGSGLLYDSIKGVTGNPPSDVYMVYLSSKAYPRYLVTYTP